MRAKVLHKRSYTMKKEIIYKKDLKDTLSRISIISFFGFLVILFSNKSGLAMVLSFLVLLGMLFLPFVLLIYALSKPARSTDSVSNANDFQESRDECGEIGFMENVKSIWEEPHRFSDDSSDMMDMNFSDEFCSSTNSSNMFDDSFSSSDTSFSDDIFFNPIYSDWECNIYHHGD